MDKVATWVSKNSVQKISVAAFVSKHCRYAVYRQKKTI